MTATAFEHWPEAQAFFPRVGDALISFADIMPVLIAYVGRDKRFRFANKTFDGWFGLSQAQICGRLVRNVVGAVVYKSIKPHIDAALAGATVSFELTAPFSVGRRTLRMTFIGDTDAASSIARGFFVLGEDLSEPIEMLRREIADRERIKSELAKKEKLLSELVETAPTLVVLADSTGRILLFNRACEELTGYPREEAIGKNLLEMFVPSDWWPTVQRRFADPRAPEVRQPHENPWITKTGKLRDIEWRCAALPVDGDNSLGVLGIGVDITERKAAERAAYQQQVELARVLRVNTMGEMAAALAHELSQPLAAILSYTQGCQRLIAEHDGADSDVVGYLEKLAGQARRAGEIVQHIRRFIQKDEPRSSLCDVNDLVREAAAFARSEATLHGIELTLNLAPEPITVQAERIAIEQVILNLFHNSVEALVGAGCDRREIAIATSTQEEFAVVGIADTGPGISPELIGRLFQAFVTSKRNGLGLGLSICRSIVRDHRGEMWLANRQEGGAHFLFSLPLAANGSKVDG